MKPSAGSASQPVEWCASWASISRALVSSHERRESSDVTSYYSYTMRLLDVFKADLH